MVEIKNSDDLKKWLEGKPKEFSVVIAPRAALRIFPLLSRVLVSHKSKLFFASILLVFRASYLSRVAAKFSTRDKERAFTAHAADATYDVVEYTLAGHEVDTAALVAVFAAIDAAYVVAGSTDAAYVAADATYVAADAVGAVDAAAGVAAISHDASLLEGGMAPEMLARQPLWPNKNMGECEEQWGDLKKNLLALDENWQVWTDWYEDILAGRNRAGLPDDLAEKLDLKIALQESEWWEQAPAKVNADILDWTKAALAEARGRGQNKTPLENIEIDKIARAELASAASPDLAIGSDGLLHVTPNMRLDNPVLDEEMFDLPTTQVKIAQVLLSSFPGNTPPVVVSCIGEYSKHLDERDVRPIVGLLQQFYSAFSSAHENEEGEIWGAGLESLIGSFRENHIKIMEHFPLSAERKKVFDRYVLIEEKATSDAIINPIEEMRNAFADASDLIGDDVVVLQDADIRSKKEIAFMQGAKTTEPKKIIILSSVGLAERAIYLVSSTVTLASTHQGIALSTQLTTSIERLLALVQRVI